MPFVPPSVPVALTSFDAVPDAAILRLPSVLHLTGLSRTTIWRRCRERNFPRPIQLGATRAIGWRVGDLRRWLAALDTQVA